MPRKDTKRSSDEAEHACLAEAGPEDEAGGMAAVSELLEEYTTLFEQAV